MSAPRVTSVAPASPAELAGIEVGDELVALNGERPRDIIRYQLLVDGPELSVDVRRGGLEFSIDIEKADGQSLGVDVHSSVFDQIRTCDNHCEFCFIYQLPKGMRKSLYLKDDDYRLSFLYGNFTTLTRFTEADLERVVTERLSPLHVSIHATDPDVRVEMLRNRRGATSLRWLRALLDHDIAIHGQVVVCPGINDGAVLEATMAGVADRYPDLASLCVVPLGISDHSAEARMRAHTPAEAEAVIDCVEAWQQTFLAMSGRRLAFLADEYYLLAGREFPSAESYEGFPMHEDGVGMARTFELEFTGLVDAATGVQSGFFASVDGAPAEGYRAPRTNGSVTFRPRRNAPVAVLTAPLGAAVLAPLLATLDRPDVRLLEVENRFFGGNTGVTGLMTGADVSRTLAAEPEGHRYLLPDVCLSGDVFLDGMSIGELPRSVEVIPTDGLALRAALR